MVNECNVIYNGAKGLMTFDKKKIVFQHRESIEDVKEGLGIIVEGSLEDKGNYAFGVFRNVATIEPVGYRTLNFFNNKGVPMQVFKGLYGDNVLLKEVYKDKTVIRGYSEDNRIIFYENEKKISKDYEGPNMYYARINELVENWEDITQDLEDALLQDLSNKKSVLKLSNEKVLQGLQGLSKNRIVRLESGVIVADGKFESLTIWDEGQEVKMAWLGRSLDLEDINYEDITEDLKELIHNK